MAQLFTLLRGEFSYGRFDVFHGVHGYCSRTYSYSSPLRLLPFADCPHYQKGKFQAKTAAHEIKSCGVSKWRQVFLVTLDACGLTPKGFAGPAPRPRASPISGSGLRPDGRGLLNRIPHFVQGKMQLAVKYRLRDAGKLNECGNRC